MKKQLIKLVLSSPFEVRRAAYWTSEQVDKFIAKPKSDREQLFFIVGSQRSGTTLLGLALDSHPDISVVDEPFSYEQLLNGNVPPGTEHSIGFKIPTWTHKYIYLRKLYPRSQFLFITRDVRAIAYSMVSLQRNKKSWIELYGAEDLERTLSVARDRNYARCAKQLYLHSLQKGDWLLVAAVCAHVKNSLYREYAASQFPCQIVAYEDLVQDPRRSLRGILDFLSIQWSESVLDHHNLHSGIAIGGTDSSRVIDSDSLEKWKQRLSEAQRSRLDEVFLELDNCLRRQVGV